jgi:Domain of Unknown Function (DUF748)
MVGGKKAGSVKEALLAAFLPAILTGIEEDCQQGSCKGAPMWRRWWIWLIGVIAGLSMVGIALGFLIDEPLRRHVEQELNRHLHGYAVRLGKLDLHPFRFAVDLYDIMIVQEANPEPAIVHVPRLNASVHWRALLSARVVGDVLVEHPSLHVNLKQIRAEAADDVPLQERGWQEALQAVLPLKINELRVVDGHVTYIDQGPFEPLRLSELNMRAGNIRNIRSQAGVYPSDIHLQGRIFDAGKIQLDGQADFLAVPHLAVTAQIALENVELNYVKPVASHYNMVLQRGTLSGMGKVEYTPTLKVIHLQNADIHRLQLDYIHTAQTAGAEQERAQQLKRAAQDVSNAPGLLLKADTVSLVKSDVGFVNKTTNPDYRLFLAGLDVHLTNFSNQLAEGTMVAKVIGKFMGSGQTTVGATFRPETKGPDFVLAASIENTQMRAMNKLLRAYGNFDVVRGLFSVYTELGVKNGTLRGYVKPLFKEMDVYDSQQDREKNLFQKIYEGLVGGISELLENVPRDEVATKAEISGALENPQASTWQVLVNLIQNAFFQSILPGFERQGGRSAR